MANTTWNPSDKSANITLSGSNLVATSTSGTINNVRAIDKQITGKFYLEYTFNTVTSPSSGAGFYSPGFSFATGGISTSGAVGTCGVVRAGSVYVDGNSTITIGGTSGTIAFGTITSGTVVCIAVDCAARLLWVRLGAAGNWNNVAGRNPATGVGGVSISLGDGIPLFPAAVLQATSDQITANFGDSAFTGTVPSGFTSGFTSGTTSPTNALATQIAVEHWLGTSPQAQVTQVAVEHWASVGSTVPQVATQVLTGSRAGVGSSVVQATTNNKTYNVADIGVVVESYVAPGPAPQTLADTATTSDVYSPPLGLSDTAASSDSYVSGYGEVVALAETISSSDSFGLVIFLTDVVVSQDVVSLNYPESLSDTTSSSDVIAIPVPLSDTTVGFTDVYTVITDFYPALVDLASSYDNYNGILNAGLIPECGPIAVFPVLPAGYPVKVSIVLDTIVGTTKSLREMRVPQQTYPLWDVELEFDELRDQTQNQVPFPPFAGLYSDYQNLVQTWLMMYGQTNVFAIDLPWDDSRTDQYLGTGDGTTVAFTATRNWGSGAYATAQPVGMINQIQNVKFNGTVQASNSYSNTRSIVTFVSPPPNGTVITMTFSYFYICRFTADEQDFEEFSKNRWRVPSLKFRAVYWPGCQ